MSHMDHKRRAFAIVLGILLLTLGTHGVAHATLIPSLESVAPSGGNFLWTYTIALALDQSATQGTPQSANPVIPSAGVGDFVTIYDFRGFAGTCSAPSGWVCQAQAVGFTPNTQTPADDPSVTNLTFTRTGSTLDGPIADLGDFTALTSLSDETLGTFTSRGTRRIGAPLTIGTKIDSVGPVSVPAPVPEPATLILLGTTMAGLGFTLRRRRRAGT